MATLSRNRWERYVPDLGENRSLAEADRLELELASGLTAEELSSLREQMAEAVEVGAAGGGRAKVAAAFATALEGRVRLRGGPHVLDGREVKTLAEYLDVVATIADGYSLYEVGTALIEANVFGGRDELFSQRRSGGWVSTRSQLAAKDGARQGSR